MVVIDEIQLQVRKLPTPLQTEVLNFVEYLLTKVESEKNDEEELEWEMFSLDMAMRGMEEEDMLEYTIDDLKVKFS